MSDFDKMEPMVNKAVKSDGTEYEPYAKGTTLQSSSERNIEKYKRSSPFANKILNADGSITEINFSSGGGGSITLPISSDDVSWVSPNDGAVTQTNVNNYFNQFVAEMGPVINNNVNNISRLLSDDGDGSTLIYVAVPGYPIMTLEQAIILIASRLRAKVNIDDNFFRNLLDVGIVNGGEVLYKDETTGEIISIDLFTTGIGGVDGSGLIRHGVDTSFTLARNTPHQIEFTSTLATVGNGTYFSKTLNGLTVDDSNKERSISYHVNLFTNGVFTYNVEVLDQDDNVIDSQEVTTKANGTTDVSFNYTYTSTNDVDTYRLFITETGGDYEGGYVTIGGTTTLGATVYTDGNLIIDPKYIPQQTYVEMEDNTNSFTLTETEQLIYTVDHLNIGQSTVMPRNFNLRFEYTRTGSGIASVSSYLNVIIKQGGVVIYNGSISTQQTGANSHSAVFTNVIKHDYDTNSNLEIYMSYDDGAGATAPGNLNLNNILGSIVVEPVV